MDGYLCPITGCGETRPTRSRLVSHMDGMHRDLAPTLHQRRELADVARPIEDVALVVERPAMSREELARIIASNNAGLDRVRREMGDIRQSLAEVDQRMSRMDQATASMQSVRSTVLNEVWDVLADAGEIGAAQLIMKMIVESGKDAL